MSEGYKNIGIGTLSIAGAILLGLFAFAFMTTFEVRPRQSAVQTVAAPIAVQTAVVPTTVQAVAVPDTTQRQAAADTPLPVCPTEAGWQTTEFPHVMRCLGPEPGRCRVAFGARIPREEAVRINDQLCPGRQGAERVAHVQNLTRR